MKAADRPPRFGRWDANLNAYDRMAGESGLDPTAFCLGFAAGQAAVARCVVGVDSLLQLEQVVAAFRAGQTAEIDASGLAVADTDLIDPRNWGKPT